MSSTVSRLRSSSINAVTRVISFDPQPGVWTGVGATLAQAPALVELRVPESAARQIAFDANGYNVRKLTDAEVKAKRQGLQRQATIPDIPEHVASNPGERSAETGSAMEKVRSHTSSTPIDLPPPSAASGSTTAPIYRPLPPPIPWSTALKHGLRAFTSFILTPTGFLLTLYSLNVVAWGALLFFLELHAAPAMNHPDNGNANDSPRKIWLEISSQVLNALFCLTAWGLAPWRFRDARWLLTYRLGGVGSVHGARAFARLCKRNASWFRPAEAEEEARYSQGDLQHADHIMKEGKEKEPKLVAQPQTELPTPAFPAETDHYHHRGRGLGLGQTLHDFYIPPLPSSPPQQRLTYTGRYAPPTSPQWKLDAQIWLMVLNSLFQVGMAFFMWHFDRITRPGWGAGTFIGLGCASAMAAGVLTWFEGRKVKMIEGPTIQVEGKDDTGGVDADVQAKAKAKALEEV